MGRRPARPPGNLTADARSLANQVLRHIREGGYTYTLEPGPYDENAIDEFWLDRKLGFCEHFASAFVVVMRAMDVPARIVTGYQGTDPEVAGRLVLDRAPAQCARLGRDTGWPGEGWVRVDPTTAVAPDRVQRGQRSLAAAARAWWPAPMQMRWTRRWPRSLRNAVGEPSTTAGTSGC